MTKENQDTCEAVLQRHGIRPTAVRILVYKALGAFKDTFSLKELEDYMESVDKSTLFRTLTLFVAHHLLHEIEDGSGSLKYCLCRNDHECRPEELHCHFYCEHCHKTFCLDHTQIPVVHCPEGFELSRIDYLLKGSCPSCRRKKA